MKKIIAQSQFPAVYNQLEPIRQFVEVYSGKYGFESNVIYNLIWSITEIVTNVIDHGYNGGHGMIEVILSREGSDFIMEVIDNAPVFDLNNVPEPDITLPLDKRPVGGLGLYITKKLMDTLSHHITDTGGNKITLRKRGIIKKLPLEDETNGT
jgi:anti-sigma regulatory factor (Ser/Thr protein kinase)